ncbi:hypothetical protein CLOHIR_00529, partial [Peptacetobacter hiranonis DSM 13275]
KRDIVKNFEWLEGDKNENIIDEDFESLIDEENEIDDDTEK